MYPRFVTHALGLLETIRVREGKLPLLGRHLARLTRSLSALNLQPPDRDVGALVRPFAALGEGVLRVEVRGGHASVTVRDLPPPEPPRVITARVHHVPYPHKTTARDVFDHAAAEAARAGADDALLLTAEGLVAEGTTWTVAWWDWEHVCTPALDVGVLPGVARARLATLVPFIEGRFARAELEGRSLFLANAVRGVVGLAALDGVPVPSDPRTEELGRRFWAV
jgi:branched-subunit amino acid aminotransferase/4-amino-4-deoxychorismate lyase